MSSALAIPGCYEIQCFTIDQSKIEHLDRDNFYLDLADAALLSRLETYVRGTLGSVFEGTESKRAVSNYQIERQL